ncbi:small VCP/p97-interacting protein [Sinocyclocheilus grahami]|uniref:small VCP/p97-interacting protein n=1 Tax=Sinocyclocheilus grahami TaxID=75366 RepID=UPI0007ACB3C5|nr:PREDICTED: small VCP/p97-interacting protein [Sinocyclocheilus grahami]
MVRHYQHYENTGMKETRRRQLAEAAEKRQKETTYRGIKDPKALERKKKKQEETEKQTMNSAPSGGGGLKFQQTCYSLQLSWTCVESKA